VVENPFKPKYPAKLPLPPIPPVKMTESPPTPSQSPEYSAVVTAAIKESVIAAENEYVAPPPTTEEVLAKFKEMHNTGADRVSFINGLIDDIKQFGQTEEQTHQQARADELSEKQELLSVVIKDMEKCYDEIQRVADQKFELFKKFSPAQSVMLEKFEADVGKSLWDKSFLEESLFAPNRQHLVRPSKQATVLGWDSIYDPSHPFHNHDTKESAAKHTAMPKKNVLTDLDSNKVTMIENRDTANDWDKYAYNEYSRWASLRGDLSDLAKFSATFSVNTKGILKK
jgi:hypothetical protein